MSLTHLNVNKDTMVGFVEHFVALGVQRELKWDLGLARWNFSCLGHLNVTADQLDGLQHGAEVLDFRMKIRRDCSQKTNPLP